MLSLVRSGASLIRPRPCALLAISVLPAFDGFDTPYGERHLIESVDQHQLVDLTNFEEPRTGLKAYFLRWQVHRHLFKETSAPCQLFDGINRERHRKNAIGEAVGREDVTEAGGDHTTKPKTPQRPDCRF